MGARTFVILDKRTEQTIYEGQAEGFGELLEQAVSSGVCLEEAKLGGKDLSGLNLEGADLRFADLSSANLENTDLSKSDLTGANLWNANLSNACLANSNLVNCDLTTANLTAADLSNCNVNGANFTGAIMDDARTQGTSFLRTMRDYGQALEERTRKQRERFVYTPLRFVGLQLIFILYQFIGAFFTGVAVLFYWAMVIIISCYLGMFSSRRWWLGVPIQTAIMFLLVSMMIG